MSKNINNVRKSNFKDVELNVKCNSCNKDKRNL